MMNRVLAAVLLSGRTLATVLELSDEITDGSVVVETTSSSIGLLDGPKISSTANDTTYDWYVVRRPLLSELNQDIPSMVVPC